MRVAAPLKYRERVKLYESLADHFTAQIREGALQAGDRLPSVRELCRERKVSPATALRAYEQLESQGLIETRPRSGYYVSLKLARAPEPQRSRPRNRSTRVAVSDLVFQILEAIRERDVVPFGSAFPSPLLFPWPRLARSLGSAARRMDPWNTVESLPGGSEELRRQIARRYLRNGVRVSAQEIVITGGALEALNLSLHAVTRPGDTVAVESPAFYAALQSIEAAGLQAVEIPTHPREGVDLAALAEAISRHDIRACWFMTSFQNPLGASMPEQKKRELVSMLQQRGIPLIEDDVYGELYFGARPKPAKAFDSRGSVLHCGSFSKCLAPGYRVGWVAAGQFAQRIERRRLMTTLAASLPVQEGIALFMQHDAFEGHLVSLRRALALQQTALLGALRRHMAEGYRLTRPDGGYFLWLELPSRIDALDVHRRALEEGISVAPGPIFSARREYGHCLRLNYGHPWTPRMEDAVARLAHIVREL